MNSDDPELEAHLRRFRPLAPRPLPRAARRSTAPWLAAAALLLAALVGWWRHSLPKARTASPPVLVRASAGAAVLALRNGTEAKLLDELDGRALPDPTRPDGALRQLANVGHDLAEFSGRRSRR